MDRKVGPAPPVRRFLGDRVIQGRLRSAGQRSRSNPGHKSVCLALAVAGLLLTGAAPSRAEPLDTCGPSTNTPGTLDAACCPSAMLSAYWPGQSPELEQTFCQLLLFPTATLSNAEEFNQRIADGSLSSDSREASAEEMTLPSLWWNRDSLTPQLGGRRLVESWISYQIKDSARQVVDVMVNPQMWSVLTYTERFAVLNQFGTAARDYGYNLRFFQGNARSSRIAGLYACEFTLPPGASSPVLAAGGSCSANLNATQIVQVQRSLLAAAERRQPLPGAPEQAVATDRSR